MDKTSVKKMKVMTKVYKAWQTIECVALHTNSDEITRDDGLHEEWKNAEIVGWGYYPNSDGLVFSVVK